GSPAIHWIDLPYLDYAPNWKDIPITLRPPALAVSLWCRVAGAPCLHGETEVHALRCSGSTLRRACLSFFWSRSSKSKPRAQEKSCLQKSRTLLRSKTVRTHVQSPRRLHRVITKKCVAIFPTTFTSRSARS